MPAGKYRFRVEIRSPVYTRNDRGERIETSTALVDTAWASVEPLPRGEVMVGKSYASTVSHKVMMRWRAGVDATMRIVFRGRNLYINGIVDPDERKRELVIYCTEKVT